MLAYVLKGGEDIPCRYMIYLALAEAAIASIYTVKTATNLFHGEHG